MSCSRRTLVAPWESCARPWRTSSSTTSSPSSRVESRPIAGTRKSTRRPRSAFDLERQSRQGDTMALKAKVVITDYVSESLDIEHKTLDDVAELVPLKTKHPQEFLSQARDCDALLN